MLRNTFDASQQNVGMFWSKVVTKTCSMFVPMFLATPSERLRLDISDSRLLQLKNDATPSPADGMDAWVSTQEALVAHLLLSLWHTFKAETNVKGGGRARVSFFVDVRRYLNIDSHMIFGTGFQVCDVYIDDMATKTLPQCAAAIHEEVKLFAEAAPRMWTVWHRAFECRVQAESLMKTTMSKHSDLDLTINNNSKRATPDFGPVAGGVASGAMTNMGPTLLLAADGGMQVVLQNDLVSEATPAKKQEFITRFSECNYDHRP